MLRITFDANVWKIVASPQTFPDAAGIEDFRTIHAAAASGKLLPSFPETVFTLEAVKDAWRQRLRGDRTAGFNADVSGQADGTMKVHRNPATIAPTHPQANPALARQWNEARESGFRLLRCPRLAITSSTELKADWYIPAGFDIVKRFDACSRGIESAGCGMSHMEAIEVQFPKLKAPWHEAIAGATVPQATAIIKAVAEWVDGDTVAAHYAYVNDYICTSNAGTAGAHSIMSREMRDTVLAKINIRFVTPAELAALLSRI
jgi:hypothetical protein